MSKLDQLATEHMRTQDVFEAEPVRVERAYIAGYRKALDEVLAGIAREQNYREYRMDEVGDQDGSAVGACKEIAGYVRAMQNSHAVSQAQSPSEDK